ncbi:MAG TPA: hypothetical protein IGS53_14775 [Leptolyngbyaceae cyanobacterium M33_DOE_097]|uniref:DDE transposase family protein n=1 Tax=Oscillatoriales cyanobacterium SpSt-418 TaxID=2282169 RepID=A0A7C3PHX7_9CYAN|nr:hypothetical protein [Leptolyngbyaceae cyanobacterium M33_DOE_097]
MNTSDQWFIVKQANGHCVIVPHPPDQEDASREQWGPFASEAEAIARRVGLIRAGKCQPQ